MRAVRLVIAALTALALSVLPMSAAGIAKQPAAQGEMSISGPDHGCPGPEMTRDIPGEVCSLKCCGVLAILVEVPPLTGQRPSPVTDAAAAALVPFTLPPDPPPPRS